MSVFLQRQAVVLQLLGVNPARGEVHEGGDKRWDV